MVSTPRARRRPFTFDSYDNDPVARFALQKFQTPRRFAIAYVLAYNAFLGLALLVYIIKDGSLDVTLLGGPAGIAALDGIFIIVGGFFSGFYLYVCRKSGTIYQELLDDGIFNSTDKELCGVVRRRRNSIEKFHKRRFWPWLGLVSVLVGLGIAVLSSGYVLISNDEVTRYRAIIVWVTSPVWSLGVYIIIMTVVRASITIWGLYRVFNESTVNVLPLHPDRCGGLVHLRNYALSLSYLLTAFGVAIVAFFFITSQVPVRCMTETEQTAQIEILTQCLHHLDSRDQERLTTAGITLRQSDTGELQFVEQPGALRIEEQRIIVSSGAVRNQLETIFQHRLSGDVATDLNRSIKFPGMWIGLVLYVLLSPLIFFGTLSSAHGPMKAKKHNDMKMLSFRFNEDYKTLQATIGKGQAETQELLNWDGRGYQRRRRLLAGLSALTVRQGSERGGSGGIGCASGTQGCHRDCLRWGQLATVPHPLHDQPAHSGPQARSALGGQHGPHHLPAAVPSGGPRTARAGDRPATGPVPSGGLSTGRGWCGRPGRYFPYWESSGSMGSPNEMVAS